VNPPRSGFLVEQFLGRFGDQLRALARTAFEEQQALAEDEAIKQEGLRVGLLGCETRRAVELADVLQPRGVDACDRGGRRGVAMSLNAVVTSLLVPLAVTLLAR
jgi:2-hydroxychromene-2-carboxylate isomerase